MAHPLHSQSSWVRQNPKRTVFIPFSPPQTPADTPQSGPEIRIPRWEAPGKGLRLPDPGKVPLTQGP